MAGINITLGGNFSKLDDLKDKAGKTASSIKAAFGTAAGKAAFAGVAAGATAAFAGVVAAVKSAIDAGGELNDMMARTGASGKNLMVMQRAFENAGLAADQVPDALNRMQKALAGVNEEGEPTNAAFGKLGLAIDDLMKLDPVDAFKRIQQSISAIQNPAQRTAVAMEIFGKSGGKMLAVMTDSGAFEQAEQQVCSLGETLAAYAPRLDAVGDAFGSLSTKFQQLGTEVATALLPQFESLASWINNADLSKMGTELAATTKVAVEFGEALGAVLAGGAKNIGLGGIADAINAELAAEVARLEEAKAHAIRMAALDADIKNLTDAADKDAAATAAKANRDPWAEPDATPAQRAKADKEWEADTKKQFGRDAMMEDFALEMAIIAARREGNAESLAAAEREKAIRQEMKRFESAGFTEMKPREMATAKVDAELAAKEAEEKRKQNQEGKQKKSEDLAGKIADVKSKRDGLEYESSIGAISDMQRIGGGGGAVASGLDYQRQTTDLQRELVALTRQLIETVRQPLD